MGGPNLFGALAKAQAKIEGATKGNVNPHFRAKYADLASVWDACREALTSNGIAVIQRPIPTAGDVVTLETILAHESGEWISGQITMRPTKADPQGIGSCLTYARRYALAAMVGVAPEDDDGNAASRPAAKPITDEQAEEIKAGLHETASDPVRFLAMLAKAGGLDSIPSVDEIPAALYVKASQAIQRKRESA
jgi:hypothetical protein